MGWFGFGKKKDKWSDVLPMLYPFDLDTDFIDQTDTPKETVARNVVRSLEGPLGLRIYLLDQSQENAALMVNDGMLQDWNMSLEALLKVAIENLERDVLPNTSAVRLEDAQTNIAFLDGANGYTASLILSDLLWPKMGFRPQDICVAIPHRELCYFGERDSVEASVELQNLSQTLFSDGDISPKHLLVPDVAVYDGAVKFHWKKLNSN